MRSEALAASWRGPRRFGRIGPALAGPETAEFDRVVRLELFRVAAATGRVPSEVEVAERLAEPREAVTDAIRRLADGKALILAPGGTSIWAANPFCAVPSGFRVRTHERTYWAICIWDALGIPASLSADATIETDCGDACGERLLLTIRDGSLADGEGVVHFGVPAARFWENIVFT